ncbi:MAG: dihydropteroate synthase [Nitrospirota bacterium]
MEANSGIVAGNKSYRLQLGNRVLELSSKTHIMGVINITPDSFSDGGRFNVKSGRFDKEQPFQPDYSKAIEAALRMAEEGADIIDVGGESTRPGANAISHEEETARVLPVIEGIRKHSDIPVSIDTFKSATALAALTAGASIINDISGLTFDPDMAKAAAKTGAAIIIMHIKGTPADMQADPRYADLLGEVKSYLVSGIEKAKAAGVPEEKILIDPGIGFGKNAEHNLELVARLKELARLGYPVVLGVSRKAFIGRLTGGAPASDRLEGTIAASVLGIANGANIIRAHDVKAVRRAADVADAILRAGVSA